MTLNSRIQVPLPDHGIIVSRSTETARVYHVLETYRDEKGHPTNRRRLIGKLDKDTGRLIPNNAYYEYYGAGGVVEMLPDPLSVTSPAVAYLVRTILSSLGIDAMLADAFGERDASRIVLVAAYMLSRGNVMEGCAEWCEGFTLGEALITSQSTSELFSRISLDKRMGFFRSWATSRNTHEYLAYDVTSMSSYAEGIPDTEWGYNRDGERLPQVNLGMYLGQDSHLPIFYATYPGSIVDKSHLPYMMAHNAELGVGQVSFVMDKGFCTTANIEYMAHEHLTFVVGVEGRHKATRAAVDSVRGSILSSANRLGPDISAVVVHGRFYGITANLHVFFDTDLANRQRRDLFRRIDADAEELAQLGSLSERDLKRLGRFHRIDVEADGSFTFEEDTGRIDEMAAGNGFFCLLTNDAELASSEVLGIYRDKDSIEKGFDELKNHLDMHRLRTHNGPTTEGKVFCAFISLIALFSFQNHLDKLMKDRNLTKKRIIGELEKIHVVDCGGGRRLMNPLTRLQKDIFGAFGITEEDFKAYVAGVNSQV